MRGEQLSAFHVRPLCSQCRDDDGVRCCAPCLDAFGGDPDDPFRGGFPTWEELVELNGEAATAPPKAA